MKIVKPIVFDPKTIVYIKCSTFEESNNLIYILYGICYKFITSAEGAKEALHDLILFNDEANFRLLDARYGGIAFHQEEVAIFNMSEFKDYRSLSNAILEYSKTFNMIGL